jgi:hypothetical protein
MVPGHRTLTSQTIGERDQPKEGFPLDSPRDKHSVSDECTPILPPDFMRDTGVT